MMGANEKIQNFISGGYKNTGDIAKRFLYKHRLMLVLLLVGIITFAIGLGSILDSVGKVNAVQREIDTIKNDIDTFGVGIAAQEEVIVKHIDHGLDTSRWQRDEQIALTLLSPAFMWSDSTSYNNNRQVLIKSLGADHWLVTKFMPEYKAAYVTSNVESDEDDLDDGTHMWCKYTSFKSYVVNIDEKTGKYSYAAIMDITSNIRDSYEDMYKGMLRLSKKIPGERRWRDSTMQIIMTFDVDKDGQFANFNMFKLI